MDRVHEILLQIHKEWQADIFVFDKENQKKDEAARLYQGESICIWKQKDIENIRARCAERNMPLLWAEEQIYQMAFLGREDTLYILGPVSEEQMPEVQQRSFRHHRGILNSDYIVPKLPLGRIANGLSFASSVLTGTTSTALELIEGNSTVQSVTSEDIARSMLYRDKEELTRYGYEAEKKWLLGIREGKSIDIEMEGDTFRQVGRMVENNTVKQNEYMVVTALTLATRAAVQGGVDWEEAMHYMDNCTQKVANCTNSIDILRVLRVALDDLAVKVQQSKTHLGEVSYIKQCKEYINMHIREKILLKEVADALGLNASYLTHLFTSQEGVTMKQYICRKKLERAANMLKYSQEELRIIANYFSFPSQSYFGEVFKKQYGLTPLEYRRMYGWK